MKIVNVERQKKKGMDQLEVTIIEDGVEKRVGFSNAEEALEVDESGKEFFLNHLKREDFRKDSKKEFKKNKLKKFKDKVV